jgi:hypothetical protein
VRERRCGVSPFRAYGLKPVRRGRAPLVNFWIGVVVSGGYGVGWGERSDAQRPCGMLDAPVGVRSVYAHLSLRKA